MGAYTRKTGNGEPISMSDGSPANLNVFGQRLCDPTCPLYIEAGDGYVAYCDAHLGFGGRVKPIDGVPCYGLLCMLPTGYKVVKEP